MRPSDGELDRWRVVASGLLSLSAFTSNSSSSNSTRPPDGELGCENRRLRKRIEN